MDIDGSAIAMAKVRYTLYAIQIDMYVYMFIDMYRSR